MTTKAIIRVVPPAAFDTVWAVGQDWHKDLAPYGLSSNINDLESRAVIEQSWRQFGAEWLKTFVPEPGCQVPWALRTFGPPDGRSPPCP